MTVPSEINRSGPYLGNGITTVFAYSFKIVNQAHLRVILTDADGNETVLTLGTNYTVAGAGNAGGGSITVSPAPVSGQKITILRKMPFTQNLDLENQGAYYADDVERAFDEAAMRDQQLAEEMKRAVKVPPGADDPDGQLSAELAKGILTLYPIIPDIKTVADNVDIVETVSDNIAEVQSVGTYIGAVLNVHNNMPKVQNVSDNMADVQNVSDNMGVVQSVNDNMPKVQNVSDNMADVQDVGRNIAAVTNIDANMAAVQNVDANMDNLLAADGSLLKLADQSYVSTAGQTEFVMPAEANSASNVLVWVDGVRQVPFTNYTTLGTVLTFTDALAADQAVDVLVNTAVTIGEAQKVGELIGHEVAENADRAEAAALDAQEAALYSRDTTDAFHASADSYPETSVVATKDRAAFLRRDGGLIRNETTGERYDWVQGPGRIEPRMFREGVNQGIEEADTDAIQMAWDYITNPEVLRESAQTGDLGMFVTKGPVLYLREGVFNYGGPGLERLPGTTSIVRIEGAGASATRIKLSDESRLIDTDEGFNFLAVNHIHFAGGLGAVRRRGNSVTTARGWEVIGCEFSNYKACAIEDSGQDNPYCRFIGNRFAGSLAHDTIGLAIAGLRAGSVARDSVFLRNRYHVKLVPAVLADATDKGPATPMLFVNNDFIRYGDRQDNGNGNRCYSVWIVPNAETDLNAGRAICFSYNKFGNEGLQNGDAHILIANEDMSTGDYPGERRHSSAASTGYVSGLSMHKDNVNFQASVDSHFILSTTVRLENFDIKPIWDNAAPEYVCNYAGSHSLNEFNKQTQLNRVSFEHALSFARGVLPPRLSNIPGTWTADDPWGYSGDMDVALPDAGVEDRGDFVRLLQTNPVNWNPNNAAIVGIEDPVGVPNGGAEVTVSATEGRAAGSLLFDAIEEGRIAYIEGSLRQGSEQSLGAVKIQISDSSGRLWLERTYRLQPSWRKFRLPIVLHKTNQTGFVVRLVAADYAAGSKTKFQFALTAAYHGAHPIRDIAMYADRGDAGATLFPGKTPQIQIWDTPFTASRAVTLSSAAWNGAKFRIVRTANATGAFNLNIGSLKSLTAGQWCEVMHNGSAWVVTASGDL